MATLPHILRARLPADQHPLQHRSSGLAPHPNLTVNVISITPPVQLREVTASAFEAEAAAGPVECYSRGCRPVFDDDEACSALDNDNLRALATPPLAASMGGPGNVLGDGSGGGLTPCQIERLLSRGVWAKPKKAECYYEAAMQLEPRNCLLLLEYALFAWNALADVPRADHLFHQALHMAPSNSSILATYASFLWQTEAS